MTDGAWSWDFDKPEVHDQVEIVGREAEASVRNRRVPWVRTRTWNLAQTGCILGSVLPLIGIKHGRSGESRAGQSLATTVCMPVQRRQGYKPL